MMRKLFVGFAALVLAMLSTVTGPAEAHASGRFPTCVRVPLNDGTFRVYVDPGDVVKGDVQTVRAFETQLRERRDGTWSGRVAYPYDGSSRLWHVVIKSDAPRFSDRRFSTWVVCKKVEINA